MSLRRIIKMMVLSVISIIATIIAIIGALNWLILGLSGFNVIALAVGGAGIAANIIYVIVGIAGIWLIYYLIHKLVATAIENNRKTTRYTHE